MVDVEVAQSQRPRPEGGKMFERSPRARLIVGAGTVFAALAIAPLAAADPAPRFIPQTHGGTQRPTVASLRGRTPRLGEGLTGADRSWLTRSSQAAGSPASHVASPPNGFDWDAAFVGAGVATVVLLFVGGSAVAIHRRVSPAH
jgi:hypothetical protein